MTSITSTAQCMSRRCVIEQTALALQW